MTNLNYRPVVLWQRIRSVPGLGRDVGVVVFLIALALGVGSYLLASENVTWPWQHVFTLKAEFKSVPNIAPGKGQEVRIAGVPVGQIEDAQATSHGTAILTLTVKTGDVVYDNARVVLRPKSPLNEMYVTIAPGGPPGRPLRDGETIPLAQTTEPVPIDDVLSHLDERARTALTDMLADDDVALASAPANLPPGLRATDATLVALRPVMTALRNRTDRIRMLSTSLGEIASGVGGNDVRLASIAESLQQTLGVVARNDDALAHSLDQLPDLTTRLHQASGGVERLSTQLNPTLDDLHAASGRLPDTLSRFRRTVGHLSSTVDAAGPMLDKARDVLGDLRPAVDDLNPAFGDLRPIAQQLDPITSSLIPYLPDLKAFVAQTASVTSLRDANGGFFRARATVVPEMIPQLPKLIRRTPVGATK